MLQNVSPSHPTQRTSQRRHTVQPTRSGPLLPSSYKPPTHPLARSASLASLCWQKVLGPLPAGLMALADSQHPPQIATAAPSLIIHSNLQPITENSLATPLKVTPHPPTSPLLHHPHLRPLPSRGFPPPSGSWHTAIMTWLQAPRGKHFCLFCSRLCPQQ